MHRTEANNAPPPPTSASSAVVLGAVPLIMPTAMSTRKLHTPMSRPVSSAAMRCCRWRSMNTATGPETTDMTSTANVAVPNRPLALMPAIRAVGIERITVEYSARCGRMRSVISKSASTVEVETKYGLKMRQNSARPIEST